jgi:hypothetical protein
VISIKTNKFRDACNLLSDAIRIIVDDITQITVRDSHWKYYFEWEYHKLTIYRISHDSEKFEKLLSRRNSDDKS